SAERFVVREQRAGPIPRTAWPRFRPLESESGYRKDSAGPDRAARVPSLDSGLACGDIRFTDIDLARSILASLFRALACLRQLGAPLMGVALGSLGGGLAGRHRCAGCPGGCHHLVELFSRYLVLFRQRAIFDRHPLGP